jgi:hypothetical protein
VRSLAAVATVALVAVAGAAHCSRPVSGSPSAEPPDASRGTPDHAPCDRAHPCSGDAYCTYAPQLCGKGKSPGACRPRPASCRDSASSVCGCDGRTYPGECAAHAAGVDLSVNGGCGATVPGFVPCGASYCDARTSYCEIVLSDVAELPTDSTCKPLPPSCRPVDGAAAGCDCFPAETRCRSFCGPVQTGGVPGLHLTCRL